MKKEKPENPRRTKLSELLNVGTGNWILMIAVMTCSLLIPFFLLSDSGITARFSLKHYQVGQLCNEDLYATTSFEFLDENATQAAWDEAVNAILPRFSASLTDQLDITKNLREFNQALEAGDPALFRLDDPKQVYGRFADLEKAAQRRTFSLLEETVQRVLERGLYDEKELEQIASEGFDSIQVVPDNSIFHLGEALVPENLPDSLASSMELYQEKFPDFDLALFTDALSLFLRPDMHYDKNATLELRREAKRNTPPVYVSITKGERILTRDTVITAEQISLIEQMAYHRVAFTPLELLGKIIYVLFATGTCLAVYSHYTERNKRKLQYLKFLLTGMLVSQLLCFFLLYWEARSPYILGGTIVPYILAPLFISKITGRVRLGAVTAFWVSCYAVLLPEVTVMSFFICLSNAAICVWAFTGVFRKLDMMFRWFYAVLACCAIQIVLTLVAGGGISAPMISILILNITVTMVVDGLAVSICESVFNLPTLGRLSELAYTDSPVLDKLARTAQGTYNHSMGVAELGATCAKAIGANVMLTRVGGMYHDIGKLDYPEYFVENQGDENKQDEIKPSLSVAIIKSHVKTGVETGREFGLPKEVLDIIASHHGNSIISYFYNKAKEMAGDKASMIHAADFRYDAPLPDCKEAGIVMICDVVEAASRTVKKPSPTRYEKLVHALILGRIEEGQLSQSQLSLTDIAIISRMLTRQLVARNHHRIEYPKERE